MAPAPPVPIARALFCPQCGQATRLTGPTCAECGAEIVLPPALVPAFHSEAEELVRVPLAAHVEQRWRVPSLAARMGAETIDTSLVSAVVFPLLLVFYKTPEALPWIALGLFAAYQALWPPLLGGTPGLRMMGLSLIDVTSEDKPDLIQSLLRVLGFSFTAMTLGLSQLALFAQPDRRGWADLLAGTRIVAAGNRR